MDRLNAHLERAWELFAEGDLPGARQSVSQCLEIDEESADALHLLGVIAISEGDHELALDALQKALEFDETFFEVMLALAELHAHMLDAPAAALPLLEDARDYAEGAQENFEVDLMEADVRLTLGEGDGAERVLRAATVPEAFSEDAAELSMLAWFGRMQLDAGLVDEAEETFSSLMQRFPEAADPFYFFGHVKEKKQQHGEAIQAFLRCLELDGLGPHVVRTSRVPRGRHAKATGEESGAAQETQTLPKGKVGLHAPRDRTSLPAAAQESHRTLGGSAPADPLRGETQEQMQRDASPPPHADAGPASQGARASDAPRGPIGSKGAAAPKDHAALKDAATAPDVDGSAVALPRGDASSLSDVVSELGALLEGAKDSVVTGDVGLARDMLDAMRQDNERLLDVLKKRALERSVLAPLADATWLAVPAPGVEALMMGTDPRAFAAVFRPYPENPALTYAIIYRQFPTMVAPSEEVLLEEYLNALEEEVGRLDSPSEAPPSPSASPTDAVPDKADSLG